MRVQNIIAGIFLLGLCTAAFGQETKPTPSPPESSWLGNFRHAYFTGDKGIVVTTEGIYESRSNSRIWKGLVAADGSHVSEIVGGGDSGPMVMATDGTWNQYVLQRLVKGKYKTIVKIDRGPSIGNGPCEFQPNGTGAYGSAGDVVVSINDAITWLPVQNIFKDGETVSKLCWISDNELAACGDEGTIVVCSVDKKGKITIKWSLAFIKGRPINAISGDALNNVWVVQAGNVYRIDNKIGLVKHMLESHEDLSGVFVDQKQSCLFVWSQLKGVWVWKIKDDDTVEEVFRKKDLTICHLYHAMGNVLAVNYAGDFYQWDEESKQLKKQTLQIEHGLIAASVDADRKKKMPPTKEQIGQVSDLFDRVPTDIGAEILKGLDDESIPVQERWTKVATQLRTWIDSHPDQVKKP